MTLRLQPGEQRSRRRVPPARVAIVNMPFALADRPSIQCGLLKSTLAKRGHEVEVLYLNLELAAELGAEVYRTVSQLRADQFLGEWLFSAAAFGYRANEETYFEACPSLPMTCQALHLTFLQLSDLRRDQLPSWVTRWAEHVNWSQYKIVGFSSTFEQNCAAFALARLIKQAHPRVTIVFGGANFDDEMGKEYLRTLEFIDYIVTGEGDYAFPELVDCIVGGKSGVDVEGVSGREGGHVFIGGVASGPADLEQQPDPDYDEYFETLFRLGTARVLGDSAPLLLFESSRGCWWGEKHHCTFCGLNAAGMAFRSKSAAAVLAELRRLSARYKIVNFEAVDNIMNMAYVEELCGALANEHHDYRIFYEVKANLRPAQLRLMARAGVNSIQPGIESLNTRILGLMRKGITMQKNLRLLKWAYYYGMRVNWNLLTGFPGETRSDYEQQKRTVAILHHLPPPIGCGPIWLERFSPYFFDKSFPVRNVRPKKGYHFIYPEPDLNLTKIAYFFDYEMDSTMPFDEHRELIASVESWKTRWAQPSPPTLVYQRAPDWMQVVDTRGPHPLVHAFDQEETAIYEFCGETDRSLESIYSHLQEAGGGESMQQDRVRSALETFCDKGLMVQDEGRFFSLALPATPHW